MKDVPTPTPEALIVRKGAAEPMGRLSSRIQMPEFEPVAPLERQVLVVEWDALNMKLFRDLLRARGHVVIEAREDRNAARILRDQRPDMILIGVHLSGRLGLPAAREIRDNPVYNDIPIIAVADIHRPEDSMRIRASGCDGFFAKPISVPKFIETVERLLQPG